MLEVHYYLGAGENLLCGPIRPSGRHPVMLGVMIGKEQMVEPWSGWKQKLEMP